MLSHSGFCSAVKMMKYQKKVHLSFMTKRGPCASQSISRVQEQLAKGMDRALAGHEESVNLHVVLSLVTLLLDNED